MQLEEFYDYKNQLMDDLLTNAEIIRLLDDNYKDSDQPERFVYSQVFPFEYVPDTIEHGQTFICCDVDVQKSLNKTFLIPVLYVWVFTHKSGKRKQVLRAWRDGFIRSKKVRSGDGLSGKGHDIPGKGFQPGIAHGQARSIQQEDRINAHKKYALSA